MKCKLINKAGTDNLNQEGEVKETFEKYSERYESWYSKDEGKLIKEIEKRAAERLIPEGKGLEVGVGSGIFASALDVDYGLDPAKELLQLARSRGVKTVLGVAEKLPFKRSSFDFILFMFTLSFLVDPLMAFREAHRVLREDGKLIVCFIPKKSPWGELYRKKKSENHEIYKHAKFYKTEEVEGLLYKSKFKKSGEVSTLFQRPGSVEELEAPTEGIHKKAGLCCFSGVKNN